MVRRVFNIIARIQLVLIAGCLLPGQFGGGRVSGGVDEEKLNGPVESVRVEKAQLTYRDGRQVAGPRVLLSETTYGVGGRKIAQVSYDAGGAPRVRHVFTYDARGALSEMTSYAPDGTFLRKTVYDYVDGGQTVEQVSYGPGGKPGGRVLRRRDASGREVSFEEFDDAGALSVKVILTYDDEGGIRELTTCAGDDAGAMIVPGGAGAVVASDAVKNSMKGSSPCVGTLLVSRVVFVNDDAGRVVETNTYAHDGSLVEQKKYAREFDERGNFIKETASRRKPGADAFEPVEVIYRTIKYRE